MLSQVSLRKGSWWAAFFITWAGIGSSIYLSMLHFKLLKVGFVGNAFCNINQYLSCDTTLMSRFAEIGPLPLAGIAFLFYLYFLGILIWVRVEPRKAAATLLLPYCLIILSVVLSLVLAYVSATILKSFCLFCVSLYLVNILLLIFVKRILKLNWREWMQQRKFVSWPKSLLYLALIFIIGGFLLFTGKKQYAQEIPQEKLNQYITNFFRQPAKTIDTQGRPFFGNPDAKIVVTEFSDFECPYCKQAAQTLKPILKQYQNQVKFVFFNYPLDQACNPTMQRPGHRLACDAAYAAYCAGQQNKFWEYHDMAFERQPKFQQTSLINMAEKLKLNVPQFKECLTSEAAKQAITADLQAGQQVGLQGTPSVYVNGRKFSPWMSRQAWQQLIEQINAKN